MRVALDGHPNLIIWDGGGGLLSPYLYEHRGCPTYRYSRLYIIYCKPQIGKFRIRLIAAKFPEACGISQGQAKGNLGNPMTGPAIS